jgi:hypothetical protein
MISKRWRERLTYTAMSLFVAWHTFALIIAPVPHDSMIAQQLRPLLHPYLTFFSLDSNWDFYAPEVAHGRQFSYDIEDASGNHHSFVPTDELSWFHPNYWWFRGWYDAVMDNPETYADRFAASLCRKHAALHPISIDLIMLEVGDFSPEDYLSGKHPLDSKFVTETTVKHVICPDN